MQAPLDKKIIKILKDPKESQKLVIKLREAKEKGSAEYTDASGKKVTIKCL